MYKVSVPFMLNEKSNKEEMLKALKKAGAEYVFLAFESVSTDSEINRKNFELLRDTVPFFKANGLKVGVWIWTFWLTELGDAQLESEVMVNSRGEPRLSVNPVGNNTKSSDGFFCPTSEKATAVMLDALKHIASYDPDIILFDDDYDYSTHLGCIGCYCDRHLEMMSERLGRKITRDELKEEIFASGGEKTRQLWYDLMGETLEAHAAAVRAAIDSVNPKIRVGQCSVMSIWGTDGTTPERISKLLAGGTKPFVRLIGAPYWASGKAWGNRLQSIIETERMEFAHLGDSDIEVVTEGDVYPRPRHTVPANYLEIFDTALRAARVGDGIHKYMFDYTSNCAYESGYIDRHIKNREIYSQIDRIFSDKTPVGVRVYDTMNKLTAADFGGIDNPEGYALDLFWNIAARMLADNSIPTTYTGVGRGGVGIAFGENARHLPKEAFDGSLILDIRAAKILTEQGVDVGIESFGEPTTNRLLSFPEENDCTLSAYSGKSAYKFTPKSGAKPVVFSGQGDGRLPDAIHYENSDGCRFLVYAFDAAFVDEKRYRSYYTQNQLLRSIEWLSGGKCVAECTGNPELYMLCSENESGIAIGLWNIFADEIIKPTVMLGDDYGSVNFINCTGALDGRKAELSEIPPFGFCFIELKK